MVRIIRHNILPALAAAADGAGGSFDGAEGRKPAVSIIVVSYNTCAMTMACLSSLMAETRDAPYEVIVVDNASSDGSAEALAGLGDQIRLIALGENIGFARANNLAALQAKGDHLLLLNPDTLVLDGAIDRLCVFANANPAAGIWGGRTLYGDRSLDPTSVWARMTLWSLACRAIGIDGALPQSGLFNAEAIGGWHRDSIRRVDIVCGCFLMIRRELWQRLGGFDRAFFMYGEEADLCLRAAKFGARPLFTPSATIVHYGGASEATKAGKIEKLFRAKITLMHRHWSRPAGLLGKGLILSWAASRLGCAIVLSLVRHQERDLKRVAMWFEVWRHRAQWHAGYDIADATAAAQARPIQAMVGG